MRANRLRVRTTSAFATLTACALLVSSVTSLAQQESPPPGDTNAAYQLLQLLNQNEEFLSEIARLRGQIEELLQSQSQSRERQQRIATDFDKRISQIEGKPEVDNSEDKARISELEGRLLQLEQALTAMHEVVTAAAREPVHKSAPETIYEQALEKYRAGSLQQATRDFEAFLQLYGDDPAAPNALYWLAEAQLRQGDFARAIETGTDLLAYHPDSDKAADTMFLLGKAHLELGDAANARRAWEELVAIHPGSTQASKAITLLEHLP